VSNEPVSSLDLLPTFVRLAGGALPDGLALDGCDLSDYLTGAEPITRQEPLLWFYYSARGYASFALRSGDYTLIAGRTGKRFYPGMPVKNAERLPVIRSCKARWHELYRVSKDPRQVYDLKHDEKTLLKEMRAEMDARWQDVKQDLVDWDAVDKDDK
jgi:arylsulfatase A-like enzyme